MVNQSSKFINDHFINHISRDVCIAFTFLLLLTACSQKPSGSSGTTPTTNENTDKASTGVSAPAWTQTEYVFQNKTNGQISIKDSGWKVILNINECVYITHLPTSLDTTEFIKAGTGQLCGGSYRECTEKLEAGWEAGGFSDFNRNKESREAYLEVYNIIDSNNLFETVGSPSTDSSQKNSWKERCKTN